MAFALWCFPGSAGMFGFALGVSNIGDTLPRQVYALLSGLNAATVGIIAVAATQLSERCITDPVTRAIVAASAGAGMLYKALWYFPVLMVLAGLTTVTWDILGGKNAARRLTHTSTRWKKRVQSSISGRGARRRGEVVQNQDPENPRVAQNMEIPPSDPRPPPQAIVLPDAAFGLVARNVTSSKDSTSLKTRPQTPPIVPVEEPSPVESITTQPESSTLYTVPFRLGMVIIVAFFTSFITFLVLRGNLSSPPLELQLFTNMYLAGTIIFGGGPVVIPLLREYTVAEGWVSSRDFLLGLAVIQAFPGPNFNFAVYLAALTSRHTKSPAIVTAILGYVGIFTPGMTLTTAMISIYTIVRKYRFVTSLLRGVNAGAVGLVWTAVYRLWEIGYLTPETTSGVSLGKEPWWVVCAMTAFVGNKWFHIPAAVSILVGGIMGLIWYGVTK
ncbi:hypothetical protein FRC02_010775 [Tulasnella sp. 418]|nr:hypothetical protein FRC02_010775 [Tulasnella sp. 418]